MASIRDVAKLAGVSRSTVSIVCNNKGYVSKETREKIERAMKELNYTPSELGRNLKNRRSNIIGIIIPDISHPFFATFVKYAERQLYMRGYKTMVCGTAGREDVEQDYLNMLERHTMDGVIMGAHSLGIEKYLQISRPILAFDRYISDETPAIHSDKKMIGELAAQIFLKQGCKKVVQLISSHTIRNFETEKDEIFCSILESHGVHVQNIAVEYNSFTLEQYQALAHMVFETCPDADGLLGVDMAVSCCMREAARRRLRIPQDIAMVSIDGTYATVSGEKIITSVVQPVEEMANQAVKIILDMVEGKGPVPLKTVMPVTIQIGDTTR